MAADEFQKQLSGFRHVETIFGDTLPKVALRELGDATLWYDLIQINNLVFPFITDDASQAGPRVLLSGQSLLVPAAVPTASAEVDPNLVFEVDLDIGDGQLKDDGSGDFLLVSGRDNLKQAISNRILTEKNELLYHPEYGCLVRTIIGRANGPAANLLAAKYVASALKAEQRLSTVEKVSATVSGDSINVKGEATPIAGRAIPINLVV